ncbi:hypothetical protein D9611_000395 [Ephemerocybe angulata]|uniref:cAMP-independent regulatory protein pac2 n=1 Tax=Ephemerocybe angulata TaxID=980116 RepID=A0A8H5BNP2_9AGAR|nr:hypothetical protein D9611_000395 [Tulosesus angulatus]
MVHAQEPTCIDLRIRSTQDTHKIFYAVQKGILKMVTRRLDADERLALRSGCVYAWEERGPHSEITGLGIERFTEGRRWTPSRVRDEFLFYYERYMPPPDSSQSGSPADAKPPRDWEPLVKQTYSVWVETENGRRKWHITAYFTQGTIDQLHSVDDIPGVGDLVVPEGHFKSTRVGKRSKTDESRGESSKSNTVTRTYAAFPSPYPTTAPGSVESQPVLMYEPYQNSVAHTGFYHPTGQPHDQDSHSRTASTYSHQDRSSASLSPPLPSPRTQYSAQTPQYGSAAPVDAKSSRAPVPAEPSHHSPHSHQPEYRPLPPMAAPAAMVPLNDNMHGQRGKPIPISSYAESSGLNNHTVNISVGLTSDALSPSSHSHWNAYEPSAYPYQPSGTTGLQAPPGAMHGMHNSGSHMNSGYNMYSLHEQQQHHQQQHSQQEHYSPAALPHHGLSPMSQQYNVPGPDVHVISQWSTPISETPRILPPLHIPNEEPSYIVSPTTNTYQQVVVPAPVPSPAPYRDSGSRPLPIALAPLHALNRAHPYKRERQDDKALRLLQQNAASSSPPL